MTKRQRRDSLAIEHLEWAHSIAKRVAGMLPSWFLAEDLTGPAEIALIGMADKYDPTLGVPFRAYAHRRIYGACFDSARRREYVERGRQSLNDHETMLTKLHILHPEDVFTPNRDSDIPDDAPSQEDQVTAGQQRKIWALVQLLPQRHALVILSMYGGGMTLNNLSGLMNLSITRLSQLHLQALGMLRKSGVNGNLARDLSRTLAA